MAPERTPPLPIMITRLHTRMRVHTRRVLAEHGTLTLSQWRLLRVVGAEIATLSTAVRREAVIDKGQFSRTLDSLVEAGLVSTRIAADDQRQTEIRLTRRGQTAYERVASRLDARHRELVADMTSTERKTLTRLLARLIDTVETLESSDVGEPVGGDRGEGKGRRGRAVRSR